jgi:hypothetical protein
MTHDLMCETFTIVKVCIIEQYLIRHSVWVIYTSEAFMLTVFLALISSVHIHAKQKQIEIKQNNFEK